MNENEYMNKKNIGQKVNESLTFCPIRLQQPIPFVIPCPVKSGLFLLIGDKTFESDNYALFTTLHQI